MTSTILQTLHQDHANQLQFLSLVETEIGKLDDVSDPADFEFLSLALEYCSNFPNRYHHHKEDRIYERLVARDPAIGDRIDDLIQDHKTLERLTREFANAVAQAIASGDSTGLFETTTQFARHYRYHIGIEETDFFPRARNVLTEADWHAIEASYREEADPLFGEQTRQAYIALQERIVAQSVGG